MIRIATRLRIKVTFLQSKCQKTTIEVQVSRQLRKKIILISIAQRGNLLIIQVD